MAAVLLKTWNLLALLLLAIILPSCSTPTDSGPTNPFITEFPLSKQTNAPPAAVVLTNAPPVPVVTLTNAPVPKPALPAPPTPAIAPAPRPHPALTRGWIPWEKWDTANHWSRPQRLRTSTSLSFGLTNSHGALEITAGNRTALWNGVNLELGFPPRVNNGEPTVHALDVVKTLDGLSFAPDLLEKPRRVVVIDPGHGGDNYGARSVVDRRFEKEFTLDWAFRLQRLLRTQGWTVYLTRTNDVDLSLPDRIAFADTVQADLFVSLHFNSTDQAPANGSPGGLETYCLTPVGMPSSLKRNFEDEVDQAFPNNAYDAANLQFAVRIQSALIEMTNRRDRGVRRARFMGVLRGQNRPAVLVEGGYLTDRAEARLIASERYRQKLAEGVATALNPRGL